MNSERSGHTRVTPNTEPVNPDKQTNTGTYIFSSEPAAHLESTQTVAGRPASSSLLQQPPLPVHRTGASAHNKDHAVGWLACFSFLSLFPLSLLSYSLSFLSFLSLFLPPSLLQSRDESMRRGRGGGGGRGREEGGAGRRKTKTSLHTGIKRREQGRRARG